MVAIFVANVVLVLIVLGIGCGILPAKVYRGAVIVLHKIIGITLPSPDKERIVAVIWVSSLLIIGDGILIMLLLLTRAVEHS